MYGSADFIGGIASRRISPIKVTALGALSGLAVLLIALPFFGGVWSAQAVLLGALSGVTGAAAIVLLYACLAIGPMSILSPLTAVVSALVPMLAGLVRGERLAPIGYAALGIALVAVVLVGFVPEKGAVRPSLKALAMAVASGTLIGVFLIVIDLTPSNSGIIPLVANRLTNGVVLFALIGVLALLRKGRASRGALGGVSAGSLGGGFGGVLGGANSGWRGGIRLALIGGCIDAAANVLLLLGIRVGELTIQSVLTALYPAGTIILAAVVLKERIAPVQIVGLVLALIAAAMLSLA